eukprot:CAMPEP_0172802064 /NCGR_PEP_ID=MMETSP1075-20121228/3651_1 /TAXON_ID=2916 /ORGANISM="Ceratium fusus, Strain PA161109" /LENGTH=90 /DNA_ID=CAMNT_0013640277 /DNA_START=120 /DNA_END=392 /DNA_ORIENTATION=-
MPLAIAATFQSRCPLRDHRKPIRIQLGNAHAVMARCIPPKRKANVAAACIAPEVAPPVPAEHVTPSAHLLLVETSPLVPRPQAPPSQNAQ